MIALIEVDGLKSLLELSIPLRKMTVLVGGNASGKSSLIQALLLLRQSVRADGAVDRLNLMGPLFEGGTASDVINPRAKTRGKDDRILRLAIGTASRTGVPPKLLQEFTFQFQRSSSESSPRVLHLATSAAPLLQYPLRPAENAIEFSYLSAERVGPRAAYPVPYGKGMAGPIGKNGEFTTAFLSRALRENYLCSPSLCTALQNAFSEVRDGGGSNQLSQDGDVNIANDERVVTQVNRSLRWLIPGAAFDAEEHAETDSARLGFYRIARDYSRVERPANIGFGLTYVLPVLAAAIATDPNGLFIAENVECHLHPRSQSRIGTLLASVAQVSSQILLETHSDHVINGIRLAVKFGLIEPSEVVFHYFNKGIDDDSTQVNSIQVDRDGNLSKWPEGFLDQISNDLSRL
jgi:predicted ATPase